jgi:hypothetical protein
MDDILNAYRELALRISVAAAAEGRVVDTDEAGISQSEAYSQNVPYTSELVRIQYAADRRNLAVAVIISVLGPVATLALFWGWWRLGRSFSLSPLEIANAFGAPMGANGHSPIGVLVSGSSNASGDELARHVKGAGDPMVRYGVGDGYRLLVALAAHDGVRTPQAGEVLWMKEIWLRARWNEFGSNFLQKGVIGPWTIAPESQLQFKFSARRPKLKAMAESMR